MPRRLPVVTVRARLSRVDVRDRLDRHLRTHLGAWPPPSSGLTVVGALARERPAWDGRLQRVVGVASPEGTVLSVPPRFRAAVARLGPDLDALGAALGDALGVGGWVFGAGVFRWSGAPTPGDDPGTWLPVEDPRVPAWLQPFGGEVLVGLVDGFVAAGVGRKRHDPHGHELAVVTDEGHRGQGWARRLVAQAARRVLADGAVPTYLHDPENAASARTADASGFPDRGWRILGLFAPGGPPG